MNSLLRSARVVINEGLSCLVWSGLFAGENKLLLNRFATRNLKIDAMFEPYLSRSLAKIWRQVDATAGYHMRNNGT